MLTMRSGEAEQPDRREEEQRVPLHPARLHVAQQAAGLAGLSAMPLTAPSTTFWSTTSYDEAADALRAATDAVDDPVDHVLVEPVDAARDRALDRRRR